MTQLIYQLMPKIIGEIGAITKSHKNTQQGYSYRGIDDITAALDELLLKHGVFYAPSVLDFRREERVNKIGTVLSFTIATVDYTFYASDGSCFVARVIGEGMDSGDKSCNKSMTSAQKTALLQVFNINSGNGDDTERESHEVVARNPYKENAAAYIRDKPQRKLPTNTQCPYCSAPDTLRPSKFKGKENEFYCSKNDGGCGKTVVPAVVDQQTGEILTEDEIPF